MEKEEKNFETKGLLGGALLIIVVALIIMGIGFGIKSCSNNSEEYNLKYLSETPTYNTLGEEVGVIVEAELKLKNSERANLLVQIPATKLLHYTYSNLRDFGGHKELTYHYGKVEGIYINLTNPNYPNSYKFPNFKLVEDVCEISVYGNTDEKLILSITYIYDSSLDKTLNLNSLSWS